MADLTVRRYRDVDAFREAVEPFLLADEAANGLPLGLFAGLEVGEWRAPYLALVARGDRIALVAMRTPPHALILCRPADPAAFAPLIADLTDALGPERLPGVLGEAEAARAFAIAWSERRGVEARRGMAQRIYRCAHVEPPTGVEGELRTVTETDRPLIAQWLEGFHHETRVGEGLAAEEAADRWVRSPVRTMWFWEARGTPVAMVGASGPTPRGIRISAVYTPPEHRRKGYASAAVAEATRRMLAEGREFCTLFTDLANPTSNKIYRQVGYRPVIDVASYAFGAAPGA